jgi:hypothetical protein
MCAAALVAAGTARSGAVVGSTGCAATQLPAGDDAVSDAVPLPFAANLYGTSYDSAYVWTNGAIGFAPGHYTDGALPALLGSVASSEGSPLVAPFYADADASAGANVGYGATTYHGRKAFCVDWGTTPGGLGPCCPGDGGGNAFEALLVDRSDRGPGDFDVIFDYGRIAWDTATYPEAIPAQAGIGGGTEGPGGWFALFATAPGWAVDGSPASLVAGSHGTDVPGRRVFPVVNGEPREPGIGFATSSVAAHDQARIVTLADVDGDGDRDLLVLQSYNRQLDVHLNDGHGSFGAAVFETHTPDGAQLATGDVNRDGHLDVVVAGSQENAPGAPPLVVLLGDGHGGFAQQTLPSTVSRVGGVGLVDTNGDGKLDIVVQRFSPAQEVDVLLGDGAGGFGAQTATPFGAFAQGGAVVADVTGDGRPDVVASDPEHGPLSVRPGDGDGGWGAARHYAIDVPYEGGGGSLDGLAVGDLDGDGRNDVAVRLNSASAYVATLLQQPDGTLGAPRFGGGRSGWSGGSGVAIGDVTGDGIADVLAGDPGHDVVDVFPGVGRGLLGPVAQIATSNDVTSVATGDLDGDGKLDAVHGGLGGSVGVLLNRSDRTPPTLTVPADLSVGATGPDGAAVTFAASASEGTASCLPASGTRFPVGETTVWCSALDAAGNTGERSFRVTVVADATPPVLSVPAKLVVDATSPAGARVTFAATATDAVDGTVAVDCAPASGGTFAIGDTTVRCTATDAAGNVATKQFAVHVQGAPEQLADLLETIVQKRLGPGFSLPAKLRAIVEAVAGRHPKLACPLLAALDHELKAQSGKKVPATDAAELRADVARIADVVGC